MLHVLGCITDQHDLKLVVLAGLLCLLACSSAMSMIARSRATNGRARNFWLAAAGVVAGCGIWGTHFVAMLAYRTGLPVAYDPSLTLLSVFIAVAMCGVGFAIALSRLGPLLGGSIAGAAIGTMHYVGMAAVRMPAYASWDVRYVIASAIIGIGLMAVAMRIAVRGNTTRSYAVGAVLFTIAIVSMHFTGMSAVIFHPDPLVLIPNAVVSPTILAIAVALAATLIVALGMIGALVDHQLAERSHNEETRLRAHIAELENTKRILENTSADLSLALKSAEAANVAKSQFLASMGHELRTPLNAVLGFSQMMKTETFGPLGDKRYVEYMDDIHASGTHLLSLINDVLHISKLDAGEAALAEEDLLLPHVAAEAARMVEPQAQSAGITLHEEFEPNLPAIRADRRQLRQVFINLLANAIKFTPESGHVRIRVFRSHDGGMTVTISDTGIGIATEDIPKAFERFGQVDSTLARKYEGAGLGLSLARQLAELHGGTLTLESKVDVGTTVTVTLPASRVMPERKVA
ncbi:MAG TPA: MHYT domain-containing protein [Rhizomicrobium sp.]|nr:MHYT domain-containing protein [Rhizomicrobium sp.]